MSQERDRVADVHLLVIVGVPAQEEQPAGEREFAPAVGAGGVHVVGEVGANEAHPGIDDLHVGEPVGSIGLGAEDLVAIEVDLEAHLRRR